MSRIVNQAAVAFARELIEDGRVDRERGDWQEVEPTPDEENSYIEENGWDAYGRWFLAVDAEADRQTKGSYSFPIGDFRRIVRAGVIAAEARAGQYDHTEIEAAAKGLLEVIDTDS